MYSKLKGFVGNVPVRLIATFLVATLIPSLLVTALGVLAVFEADRHVKQQASEPYLARLRRLSVLVGREWERRFEEYRLRLRDAHERLPHLTEMRGEPYIVDVLVSDASGLRSVPAVPPPREIRLDAPHAELDGLRRLEAGGGAPEALLEGYRSILDSSPAAGIELAALLGASRASLRLDRREEAIRFIDEALRLHGDAVDENAVALRVPLLLRKLELLDGNRPADRDPVAEELARALETSPSGEEMMAYYRRRLGELAPAVLRGRDRGDPAASAGRVPASLLEGLSGELPLRAQASPGEPLFTTVPLPSFGDAVFASFPSAGGAVTVHLLLDGERFLEDARVFLEDVGIPERSLLVEPAGSRGRRSYGGIVASVAAPAPFQMLEWRYAPEPGTLPPGFRSFEVFRAASFTWGVIVLVLTILVGTFMTLRVVLREMQTARMKSDFVSFISHELKTPLAAIRMFSETLIDGRVSDEEDVRTCLRLIDRESERLTNLIDRVLEYSRIQSRRKIFQFTSCSMKDVVEQAVEIFHEHHKNNPREIEVNAVQHISKIRMDRASMVELMLNLLSNAGKYSPPDKKIVINVRESISEITVEVVDHGVGIRKRDQRKIFDKFYRADDFLTRDIEGYGLGLAFARYIARQHKGDIRVSSQVNSGSVFTLHLQKTDVLAE